MSSANTTANRPRVFGNGSVYYDKNKKKWIGAFIAGTKPDGKPDRKTVRADTEGDCHRKLNALIKEESKKEYVYVEKDILSNYLSTWLTTVKRLQLKDKSYDRLEDTITKNVVPAIGQIQVSALKSDDIQKMISDMQQQKLSYSTIKKAYDAVNSAFKWGQAQKPPKVKYNPCIGVELPSRKKFKAPQIKFYTQEEAKLISETALKTYPNGYPWYPLGGAVVLLLNTGLRIGELAALEWERDIDLEGKMLYVHSTIEIVKDRSENPKHKYKVIEQDSAKTDESFNRPIPLNNAAVNALETLKKQTGMFKYVFATREGNRKSLRDLDKIVRRVLKRAGMPEEKIYGAHAFRHTFATIMLKNGVDVKVVAELLGHSDISVTYNTYVHIIKEQKAKAIQTLPELS